MAVLPLSVHTSRTILVVTPLVCFATMALIECVRLSRNHPRNLQCGLFIGLAAACKYTGALLIVPYVIAHLLRKPIHVRPIGFGIATCGITFLLVSPYCLLDFSAFGRDFSFERTHMGYGHFGVSASPAQYVYNLWSNFGVGIIAILASTFALLSNLQNHRQWLPLIHCQQPRLSISPTKPPRPRN
jgi:4-amino-4-deoxy-L-arabinose transferase-like glycosyltransferase